MNLKATYGVLGFWGIDAVVADADVDVVQDLVEHKPITRGL